ncbi:MAG: hypothetical protein COB53_08830 [Elusimicrobia bacterium]|nr:MAG: hypothetical protein COB53_08830 [Elusimicrobiota bacterium]
MAPSTDLIAQETPVQEAIRFSRGRIVEQERNISNLIDRFVALEMRLEDFHEQEYWPKVGIHAEELDVMREKILGRSIKPEAVHRKERPRKKPAKEKSVAPGEKDELKKLYRDLAKRYHPDAAPHAKDKQYYETRMSAVNDAFSRGDLRTLRRMFEDSKAEIENSDETDESRLRTLRIDETILGQLLRDYGRRLSRLEGSSVSRLMQDVRKSAEHGIDVLGDMADGFKRRIAIYQDIFEGMSPSPKIPPSSCT